jgi:8-oxo-dGTP diphosphatase
MRPLDGDFEPGDEVDEMQWLSFEEAVASLSHEHDRELVRSVRAPP